MPADPIPRPSRRHPARRTGALRRIVGLGALPALIALGCAPQPVPDDTAAPDDTGPDPDPYGFLPDDTGALGLRFAADGTANGGACLALDVVNLNAEPLEDWTVDLTLDRSATVVASEGLWVLPGDTPQSLRLLPDTEARQLPGLGSASARVCTDPSVVPTAVTRGSL